jgi:hypothetical protein
MKVYKIRRIKDGLFSMGGDHDVKFTKTGKIWKQISHLHNHLNQFNGRYSRQKLSDVYTGCEVVIYELEMAEERTVVIA